MEIHKNLLVCSTCFHKVCRAHPNAARVWLTFCEAVEEANRTIIWFPNCSPPTVEFIRELELDGLIVSVETDNGYLIKLCSNSTSCICPLNHD